MIFIHVLICAGNIDSGLKKFFFRNQLELDKRLEIKIASTSFRPHSITAVFPIILEKAHYFVCLKIINTISIDMF